jgi:hypothetical protein
LAELLSACHRQWQEYPLPTKLPAFNFLKTSSQDRNGLTSLCMPNARHSSQAKYTAACGERKKAGQPNRINGIR